MEHDLDALHWLTEQIGMAIVAISKGQAGGGRCMQSHFVLDSRARHVVTLAGATISIDPKLRHNKNGQAACSIRVAINTRKHEVNNVISDIVLTIGDINFMSFQTVTPSSAGMARVFMAPTSEPAPGSVSAIVPVHSPPYIFSR